VSKNKKHQELPSNFKFGLFIAALFSILTAFLIFQQIILLASISGMIFIGLIGITFLKSDILLPLNKSWMRLGLLMSRVAHPIILGFIFFILIAPVAIYFRLIGRDELKLKKRLDGSFWLIRSPQRYTKQTFVDQS
jgi:hypothetical protein